MKKYFMTTSILLVFGAIVAAQMSPPSIIVDVSGRSEAVTKDGYIIDLEPGVLLNEGSKIIVGNEASVLLLRDNEFVNYTKRGEYEVVKMNETIDVNNYDAEFADYIRYNMAVTLDNVDDKVVSAGAVNSLGDGWGSKGTKAKGGWGSKGTSKIGGWGPNGTSKVGGWGPKGTKSKGGWGAKGTTSTGGWGANGTKAKGGWGVTPPKKTGGWGATGTKAKGGWGATGTKSKGGWGVEKESDNENPNWDVSDMTLESAFPGGHYDQSFVELSWSPAEGVDSYMVCVIDEDMNMVDATISDRPYVVFDFRDFDTSKTYYWQVFAHNKKTISQATVFKVKNRYNNNTNSLRMAIEPESSDIYDSASPAMKGLMEAIALENSQYFYDATKQYESLMYKYPNNKLIIISYAAFCQRMEMNDKALDLFKKI